MTGHRGRAPATSLDDEDLLRRLGTVLLNATPPAAVQVATFGAQVAAARVAAEPGEPGRGSRRLVLAAASVALSAAIAAVLLLAPSPQPSSGLERLRHASAELQADLNRHSSRLVTVDAIDKVTRAMAAVSPSQRRQIPPATTSLLNRACRHAAAVAPSGLPLPRPCANRGAPPNDGVTAGQSPTPPPPISAGTTPPVAPASSRPPVGGHQPDGTGDVGGTDRTTVPPSGQGPPPSGGAEPPGGGSGGVPGSGQPARPSGGTEGPIHAGGQVVSGPPGDPVSSTPSEGEGTQPSKLSLAPNGM